MNIKSTTLTAIGPEYIGITSTDSIGKAQIKINTHYTMESLNNLCLQVRIYRN